MDATVTPIMIEDDSEMNKKVSTPAEPSKGGWNAAIFIICVEVADRFAFYGLSGNLIQFLTNNLHEATATAAKNVNTWIGVSSIFPIFGGILADSILGRFKTILLSSLIYLMGMVLLTLSVSTAPMHHREAVFFVALYIMAVGEGGHRPCVQTFAADQFDEDRPEEKAAKSSFFNWWYLGIVFGASLAVLVAIYIQDNVGWTAGFATLGGTVAAALLVFLMGIKTYRKEAPVGSPFARVAQVFVAAARKWRVKDTRNAYNKGYDGGDGKCGPARNNQAGGRTLGRTNQFRFLDKAMIIDKEDVSTKQRNPWRLCSVDQVEEVKLVLRLIPIWLSCLMFAATIVPSHTFYTKQGSTMVRSIGPHFHLPPAALQSLIGLTILVTVPIYDRIFVPVARTITGRPSGITMLQRIGIGLFVSTIGMVVAALVESKRVHVASVHGLLHTPKAIVPMSVTWLLPQYMIGGIADVFTIVGLQELFYDQMPEGLRSIGAAAYISVTGFGSFVNTAIMSVVQAITSRSSGGIWLGDNLNQAHIDGFYWVLAVLGALNFCVYLWVASNFVYKNVEGKETQDDKDLSVDCHLEANV